MREKNKSRRDREMIFEHPTIISKNLSLGQGTIALVSDKDSLGSESHLIDPNKERLMMKKNIVLKALK